MLLLLNLLLVIGSAYGASSNDFRYLYHTAESGIGMHGPNMVGSDPEVGAGMMTPTGPDAAAMKLHHGHGSHMMKHMGQRTGYDAPDMNIPEVPMGHDALDMNIPEVPMGHDALDMNIPEVPMGHDSPDMNIPEVPMGHDSPDMNIPEVPMGHDALDMNIPEEPMGHDAPDMNIPEDAPDMNIPEDAPDMNTIEAPMGNDAPDMIEPLNPGIVVDTGADDDVVHHLHMLHFGHNGHKYVKFAHGGDAPSSPGAIHYVYRDFGEEKPAGNHRVHTYG